MGHISGGHPAGAVMSGDPLRAAGPARRSTQRPKAQTLFRQSLDDAPPPDTDGDGDPHPVPASLSVLAPPPRRATRSSQRGAPDEGMFDVLKACVRRCCGLQSSTLVGKAATPVTATVVGDPASRSRAIILRYGGLKRDAVTWVSARRGLMCSCFSGTLNAPLLSDSARSSDCRHTAQPKRCLPAAGVPVAKFQRRMQLQIDAVNFAISTRAGSTALWTVLCQSVFSMVSFTAANVAT